MAPLLSGVVSLEMVTHSFLCFLCSSNLSCAANYMFDPGQVTVTSQGSSFLHHKTEMTTLTLQVCCENYTKQQKEIT